MTTTPDHEWDELASVYRKYKRLHPLSAKDAEDAYTSAPDASISQREVDSIVHRLTALSRSPTQDQPPGTPFPAMSRVRLKGDVSRQGVATGETQQGRRGKGLRYQVKFPDTSGWIPEDQLELVPAERESPIDLMKQDRLGRAVDLRRTLTHFRLSGRLADVIYSMESTNTDFYAYQFKPVLRFLLSPTNSLLIADEVGLGKTIEAGLIWTELKSRFDLRRLLVLCPAVLRDKWERELRNKIGVRADIVDAHKLLRNLRDPDLATRGFAMIASLQGSRPHRNWQSAEEPNSTARLAQFLERHENEKPLIDLLIIDEAHYLRNPESQTNELGCLMRAVSEHLLLLSATPIHNRNHDLFTLLRLLDPDTFGREDDFLQILEASRPLIEARDELLRPHTNGKVARLLAEAHSHSLLSDSRQLALVREQAADPDRLRDANSKAQLARRLELINPLAYVITRTRKRDVSEWRVLREPNPEEVPMHPAERAFYDKVTAVVIRYAMARAANERFLLATPQRQMCSSMPASLRAWQQRRDSVDDFAAASVEKRRSKAVEIGPLTRELIEHAYELGDLTELQKHDSKYMRVHSVITDYFDKHPTEKVVLFSTFRETLNYLGERLSGDGIPNVVMHGGIDSTKEEVLSTFESDPKIRILLSSEVGSEGIDLQFCRVLINYDLPWNPMRVEQRIGRLDRIGQAARKILIWNLFYAETIDALIYTRLYDKLDLCRQALGDFEAVLGDEMRRLTADLLSDTLNPQQQASRIDQTAQALANMRDEQEQLEEQASHLMAYGDYILNQVRAARELHRWINGNDLRSYVTDFFRMRYPGCEFRQIKEDSPDFDVSLSPLAQTDLEEFIRTNKLSPQTGLLKNRTGFVRCRFENKTAETIAGHRELISQFHPVVRFVSDAIRKSEEQLSPAVSVALSATRIADKSIECGRYLLAVSRWSIEGINTVERLAFAAAKLDANREWCRIGNDEAEFLASACAQYGQDWFDARTEIDIQAAADFVDHELFGHLDDAYKEFVDDMERQNQDRADLQLRNLTRHRKNQLQKLSEVRQRHSILGREAQVKMTDGRIEALRRRIEQKEEEIEKRRKTSHRSDEILVAIICIT